MQKKVQILLEADYEIHSLGWEKHGLKKWNDYSVQQHMVRVFKTLYSCGFTMRYILKKLTCSAVLASAGSQAFYS